MCSFALLQSFTAVDHLHLVPASFCSSQNDIPTCLGHQAPLQKKIIESLDLKGISKGQQVQLPYKEQGHLQLHHLQPRAKENVETHLAPW